MYCVFFFSFLRTPLQQSVIKILRTIFKTKKKSKYQIFSLKFFWIHILYICETYKNWENLRKNFFKINFLRIKVRSLSSERTLNQTQYGKKFLRYFNHDGLIYIMKRVSHSLKNLLRIQLNSDNNFKLTPTS